MQWMLKAAMMTEGRSVVQRLRNRMSQADNLFQKQRKRTQRKNRVDLILSKFLIQQQLRVIKFAFEISFFHFRNKSNQLTYSFPCLIFRLV